MYLAHEPPVRLVVFVHGFAGGTVRSWRQFPDSGDTNTWWRASDLLFVGYDSLRENITGVAARIRRELPFFYPTPPARLGEIEGIRVRPLEIHDYGELLLVGHSLGAVIIRRLLVDCAQHWRDALRENPTEPMPAILQARTRLFSPASAGFQPANKLGVLWASPGWLGLNMLLRRSSAFSDLQPNSTILVETRRRTEEEVGTGDESADALRAFIAFANPDDVVITERYSTDHVESSIDLTTHRSVCKPNAAFDNPRRFVETGSPH